MKNLATLATTLLLLLTATIITVLYSDGWRVGMPKKGEGAKLTVIKTGMLAVRSIPEGAKVYVDNKLTTATDDTIASLKPKKYNLKITKEGFEPWEKVVMVYPELVTDITAILVLQSPRLEPFTNTDVKAFALSSNQNNIAFLTKNHKKPGVWLLPLANSSLNMFKSGPQLLIEDNVFATPSLGEDLWWSPDDKELLVKMNETGYLLYELSARGNTNLIPQSITDVQKVLDRWDKEEKEKYIDQRLTAIQNTQEIPDWILKAVEDTTPTWSPDDKKFFFLQKSDKDSSVMDVIVYNAEIPLPVGEKRIYTSVQIVDPKNTDIQWYSDSYHFVLLERSPDSLNLMSPPEASSGGDSTYTVSIVRIDGSNPTPIYTGKLASDKAYPTPHGDKIIVLTSLKENLQNNLYGIAIR